MSYYGDPGLPAGCPVSDRENEMRDPLDVCTPCPGGCGAIEPEDCQCEHLQNPGSLGCHWDAEGNSSATGYCHCGLVCGARTGQGPRHRMSRYATEGSGRYDNGEELEDTGACPNCGYQKKNTRACICGFGSFRGTVAVCNLCGADPCESPSACRSQARFENEPVEDNEQ